MKKFLFVLAIAILTAGFASASERGTKNIRGFHKNIFRLEKKQIYSLTESIPMKFSTASRGKMPSIGSRYGIDPDPKRYKVKGMKADKERKGFKDNVLGQKKRQVFVPNGSTPIGAFTASKGEVGNNYNVTIDILRYDIIN